MRANVRARAKPDTAMTIAGKGISGGIVHTSGLTASMKKMIKHHRGRPSLTTKASKRPEDWITWSHETLEELSGRERSSPWWLTRGGREEASGVSFPHHPSWERYVHWEGWREKGKSMLRKKGNVYELDLFVRVPPGVTASVTYTLMQSIKLQTEERGTRVTFDCNSSTF